MHAYIFAEVTQKQKKKHQYMMCLNSNFLREKKEILSHWERSFLTSLKFCFLFFSHYSWYIYPLAALIHFLTSSVTQTFPPTL